MRKIIFILLMLIGTSGFAQKHIIHGEIEFTAIAIAVNYEGFISEHFSLGAKLGFIIIGAEANYYFKPIDYDQWNGHIGLSYDLTAAWLATSTIYGPTLVIGGEHISSGGFLIGLEAGAMAAQYFDYSGDSQNTFYPMINFKLGKVF